MIHKYTSHQGAERGGAATAQHSVHVAAGEHVALTAMKNLAVAVGRSIFASAHERFSLFARKSISTISATGDVRIQAQQASIQAIAQQVVEIIGKQAINLSSEQSIDLAVPGAHVHIGPDGVFIRTTGRYEVHSASWQKIGPEDVPVKFPVMPTGELFDEAYILHDEITGVILPHHKYRLKRGDGSYEEGITDEHGQTHVVSAVASEEITVEVVEEL